jgi:hypothetical protein
MPSLLVEEFILELYVAQQCRQPVTLYSVQVGTNVVFACLGDCGKALVPIRADEFQNNNYCTVSHLDKAPAANIFVTLRI